MSQFNDFLTLETQKIPQGKQKEYVERLLDSIDKQTKDGKTEIQGLQVRIKATHASRLTGHYHLYTPNKVKAATDSFVKPFNKPVCTHHDLKQDPIGRIKSAVYINTPNTLIPASVLKAATDCEVHDKKNLQWVRKINKHLNDRSFEGLGYVTVVANVTSQDGMEKILDGRYQTVSIGYDSDSLHCSVCFQDWLADGKCDHVKGQMYDGVRCFLIFGNLTYNELSYVNEPADELAGNEEIKRINIELNDSLRGVASKTKRIQIIKSALGSGHIIAPELVRTTRPGLYMYDSMSDDFIPVLSEIQSGTNMIIKETLGTDSYTKVAVHLPEGKALSIENLAKVPDTDFVGPDRMLPAFDIEHIDASKKLLGTFEDSDEKTELNSFLDTRLQILVAAKNSVVEKTDAGTPAAPIVASADSINYSFNLGVNGWGIPDPECPHTEHEIAILQMLMGMYTKEAKDFMATKFKDDTEENRIAFADSIVGKKISFEDAKKVSELEVELNTHKNEYKVAQDALTTQQTSITSLQNELKDFLIEKILVFKASDGKVDPEGTDNTVTFKDMSIGEIRASYNVVKTLFDKKDTVEIIPVQNTTHSIEKSFTDAEIDVLKKNIDSQAAVIKSQNGDVIAQRFIDAQYVKLEKMKLANKEKETK